MWIVKGNKKVKLNALEFADLLKDRNKVVVDLGTGDGRFIYKNALENPDNFYIGIDPAEKQLEIYSRKSVRKRLNNILFVLGSVELVPEELKNCADFVFINLPWGTLLETIAKPIPENVRNISYIMKIGALLEIVFGYDSSLEPTETQRLNLSEINLEYIKTQIIPCFHSQALELRELSESGKSNLESLNTTWGKTVNTSTRAFFRIVFIKK